ncbi:MAG: hypothetical protein ACK4VS_10615 [Burkholderiales bacterium]|jgi:hypothetical protein|nr:hypothetical protein [Burkholderiales bacterium]
MSQYTQVSTELKNVSWLAGIIGLVTTFLPRMRSRTYSYNLFIKSIANNLHSAAKDETQSKILLFFQRVVIMAFCFNTFAMRKVYFSSVLAVPAFRSIISKPYLTRRCSGLTHKAASTAELIR